jgi:WD40 repeat protein
LTGSFDGACRIFGLNGGLESIYKHTDAVKCVDWLGGGTCIAGVKNTAVAFGTDGVKFECVGHTDTIESVAVDQARSIIATAGWDKTVRVWNNDPNDIAPRVTKKKGKKTKGANVKSSVCVLEGHTESLTSLRWANEGLYSGSYDHSVKLWDVAANKCVQSLVCISNPSSSENRFSVLT